MKSGCRSCALITRSKRPRRGKAENADNCVWFHATTATMISGTSLRPSAFPAAKVEGAMSDRGPDAWEKAAACEMHAQATTDGKLQQMFRKLRDSWIRIGNAAQFSDDLAANAERLDKAAVEVKTR